MIAVDFRDLIFDLFSSSFASGLGELGLGTSEFTSLNSERGTSRLAGQSVLLVTVLFQSHVPSALCLVTRRQATFPLGQLAFCYVPLPVGT